jgi:hypothetical protein
MLLTYFLKDFEMVPVAPIITGITLVFTSHMRCISIVSSLYFKIFSAYYYYYPCSFALFIWKLLAIFINSKRNISYLTHSYVHDCNGRSGSIR